MYKEWQYINYEGPSVLIRPWLDRSRKFRITGEISAVLVHYRDEIRFDRDQFVLRPPYTLSKGVSWGANVVLSGEYYLRPRLSISANAGYFYSEIRKVSITTRQNTQNINLNREDYIDLSRLDYGLGINYYF